MASLNVQIRTPVVAFGWLRLLRLVLLWTAERGDQWDELIMWLGSPEGANAIPRARQIQAYGWALVAVIFGSGKWTFRRPHRAGQS